MALFHFCKRSHCVDELRRRGWGPGLCILPEVCEEIPGSHKYAVGKGRVFYSNHSRESSLKLYQNCRCFLMIIRAVQ